MFHALRTTLNLRSHCVNRLLESPFLSPKNVAKSSQIQYGSSVGLFITVKGHEPMVLRSYETFVKQVCENLSLNLQSDTRNRPKFLRLSMNRSPFIYKKHQRQYEFRTHHKYFTVKHVTGCTADVFLEYIQRNLPEGVAMEVEKNYHLYPE
ncbi:unnamed protein product [Trichobilharzia regenti]|nr:unnamed protein product [Trichobilharzia regenti]